MVPEMTDLFSWLFPTKQNLWFSTGFQTLRLILITTWTSLCDVPTEVADLIFHSGNIGQPQGLTWHQDIKR